jgi:hypothetical protein
MGLKWINGAGCVNTALNLSVNPVMNLQIQEKAEISIFNNKKLEPNLIEYFPGNEA